MVDGDAVILNFKMMNLNQIKSPFLTFYWRRGIRDSRSHSTADFNQNNFEQIFFLYGNSLPDRVGGWDGNGCETFVIYLVSAQGKLTGSVGGAEICIDLDVLSPPE